MRSFFSSIRWKVLLAFLLIVGISFSYMVNALTSLVANQLYSQRMRQDSLSVEKLATTVAPFFQSARYDKLNQLLSSYGGEIGGRLMIIDSNGKVQYDTYYRMNGTKFTANEVLAVLTGGKSSSYGIHKFEENGETELVSYCASSIIGTKGRLGVLLLVSPMDEMASLLSSVQRKMLYVFIMVAAVVLIMAMIFSHILTKPIAEITKVIKKMGKGDLSARVHVKGSGELSELARNYNSMAQQLENLDNDKSQFISNASHELKTPLATMKITLENLIYQPDMPQELRNEFMSDMDHEIDRLTAVVTDLLTLSKMDAGKAQLNMQEFDFAELVHDTIHLLMPGISEHHQSISASIPECLVIKGDKSKLGQVVYNIIENARKYTPDMGKISVSVTNEDGNVIFTVSDNGIGISKEDQEHIFERFYRVDKARSRETGGTGLGLAIVRQMVTLHGGTVEVKSKPGKGSTFTVTLPQKGQEENAEVQS